MEADPKLLEQQDPVDASPASATAALEIDEETFNRHYMWE
jgi:hypothetical protein